MFGLDNTEEKAILLHHYTSLQLGHAFPHSLVFQQLFYSPSLKNGDRQTPQIMAPKKISGSSSGSPVHQKAGRFLEEIAPPAMHGTLEEGMF